MLTHWGFFISVLSFRLRRNLILGIQKMNLIFEILRDAQNDKKK